MKRSLTIILLILTVYPTVNSQVLKGRITGQTGESIQYATIYIRELKEGTTSNSGGYYELRLPSGKYNVVCQSLGYQPVDFNITVTGETRKDITLLLQYYQIPEIKIMASGEDPAYMIMRRAIGLAPYYLNNVSYYKADVYLKGNLIINKIPRLLRKSMKIESSGNETSVSAGGGTRKEEKYMKAGDSFMMESVNEIEFTAPDKYFQKMISYNSTFPAEGNGISPMSFIQASFYQPILVDMAISPLAPNAFSHYRFRYLGASQQGNFTINKIEVIPKRKSQQLFEGTIYIIEDLWCLQSVDLTNENFIGKVRVRQLYIPVQDDIWMPVSHQFDVNIGIIGFKADAGYTSSVKYNEVKPNLKLQKPSGLSPVSNFNPTQPKSDTVVSKSRQQIEKIMNKEKLSNRDMVKLSNLMKKESEKDSTGKSLEITDHTTRIVEKDAAKKDSSYWAKVRPIPLSEIELRSLRKNDSIRAINTKRSDTIAGPAQKEKASLFKVIRGIGLGYTWSDTSGFRLTYGGLIKLQKVSFNPVDGFSYGTDISFSKTWNHKTTLSINPDIKWTFSRKKVVWNINASLLFDRMRSSQIFIRAGITSKDINTGGGINPFINTDYSLFLKRNYLKLYESRYYTLGMSGEIVNGLSFEFTSNFDDRSVLRNTTNFSILKSSKLYTPNDPVNDYLLPGTNEINSLINLKHLDLQTKLSFTPYQRYRIVKGTKIREDSDWPTFELTWEHGLNEFASIPSGLREFDMIRFEVSHRTRIGAFGEFKWRVRTAGFLDNRDVPFYDFFHINSQPLPVLLNNYEDAFMLPQFYSMSTPEFYVESHIKYTSSYLLLKLLPVLSNSLMRENLSLSYLGSRFRSSYSEIGYSLSEIFLFIELGVYTGFDDLRYNSTGVKLVFRFN